jgi:hypothetical protein
MDDVRPESHVVTLGLKRYFLLRSIDMERYPQDAFDQHGDRRAVSVCPRMGSLFAVRVYAPFKFDIGLVSQSQFGSNKLTDEPPAAAHLVSLCVAKVERPLAIHPRSLAMRMVTIARRMQREAGRHPIEISEVGPTGQEPARQQRRIHPVGTARLNRKMSNALSQFRLYMSISSLRFSTPTAVNTVV